METNVSLLEINLKEYDWLPEESLYCKSSPIVEHQGEQLHCLAVLDARRCSVTVEMLKTPGRAAPLLNGFKHNLGRVAPLFNGFKHSGV